MIEFALNDLSLFCVALARKMGLKHLGGDRPMKKKSVHPKKARVSESEQEEPTPIAPRTTKALPTTPPVAPPPA